MFPSPGLSRRCIGFLDGISEETAILAGFASTVAIAYLDCITPHEVFFPSLHFFPIALVAWRVGRVWTFVMPATAALAWAASEVFSGKDYSDARFLLWNFSIRLTFFLASSCLAAMARHYSQAPRPGEQE
jgi:hypothetical protein